MEPAEPESAAALHNAGQIVVVKHERTLAAAGADNDVLGAYLQQATLGESSHEVAFVESKGGRFRQDSEVSELARKRWQWLMRCKVVGFK